MLTTIKHVNVLQLLIPENCAVQVLFLVFASFTSAYLVMGSRLPLRALIEKVAVEGKEKSVAQDGEVPTSPPGWWYLKHV